MFPEVFAHINDRTHTPIKGSLLTIVASVFWAILMFTTFGFLVSAANTSFWFAFFYLIFAVAAIVLPYKRKDIWEKGIKKRFFGIPDSTFLGALAAFGMLWILALSTIGISLLAWNVSLLWMLLGILVFVYYANKMSKRGISIVQVYGEVPPP
jgi:amino acid transporter